MTSRAALASLLLTLAAATSACTDPAADGAESSEAVQSEDQLQTRPDTQLIPHGSEAVILANVAEFRQRNGATWEPAVPQLAFNANVLTGTLTSMRRNDGYGPDVTLTSTDAIAEARAFFLLNADLIGLSSAEILAADFQAQSVASATNKYAWVVSMTGESRQAGYEAFDTVKNRISFSLSIGRDGAARNMSGLLVRLLPKLTLSTTPIHEASHPTVRKHLLGRDLTWFYADPTPYDNVDDAPAPDHVGAVTAGDITSAKPTIFLEWRSEETLLRLAWEIHVTKGGHEWTFIVDTKTGDILNEAASPWIHL